MTRTPNLRYVDPHKKRGRLYLAFCRFSATKLAAWLSVHVMWKVDPLLLKVTGGRFCCTGPVPTALLDTRGGRTGQVRRNAAIYFNDGERVTVVASNRGLPKNPDWYYNLRKHPDVLLGGVPFRAEVVQGEAERRRLWDLADRVFPQYVDFRDRAARAGRIIPIIRLIPPLDLRCLATRDCPTPFMKGTSS